MVDSQLFPSTEYMEASLVHNPDPGLHHRLPETPLSQANPITIGRQAGVHLLIHEGSVSRRHAIISYINEQYMVQDLGSTNGTFVNNERVELARPRILHPKDLLRFGNVVTFRFLLRLLSPGSQTSRTSSRLSVAEPDKTTTLLERIAQGRPVLNHDGTLSSPGIEQPVPASVVATFKEVPALIILPVNSGGENRTPPWVCLLKPGRSIAIGREQRNDITLSDPVVSRHHAELFLASNGCYIRDLGSSNGVIINRVRIERPCRLSHGDHIKLGETIIFFVDLRNGHEQTQKHAIPARSIERKEKKITKSYNVAFQSSPVSNTSHLTAIYPLASNLASEDSTSHLTTIYPPVSSLASEASTSHLTTIYPPVSSLESGAGTSHLAAVYNGAAQSPSTGKATSVLANRRKIGVVICSRCGVANTQVARFCASCSAPLAH